MTWYKPWTWFKRKAQTGAFVDVMLDKGFGIPGEAKSGFGCILHITDLSPSLAYKAIVGKAFDWHVIPFAWRHNLEISGFHAAPWDEVKLYLREE